MWVHVDIHEQVRMSIFSIIGRPSETATADAMTVDGYRIGVVPDEVVDPLAPGLDRVVRRDALVRTPGGLLALEDRLRAHVLRRDVVARWQPRLEEHSGPLGLGDDLAVDADPDAPRALQDVYPVVGVAGVDEDLLVLLVPRVYLVLYLLTFLS